MISIVLETIAFLCTFGKFYANYKAIALKALQLGQKYWVQLCIATPTKEEKSTLTTLCKYAAGSNPSMVSDFNVLWGVSCHILAGIKIVAISNAVLYCLNLLIFLLLIP